MSISHGRPKLCAIGWVELSALLMTAIPNLPASLAVSSAGQQVRCACCRDAEGRRTCRG